MADLENREEFEAELAKKLGKLQQVQLARLLELLGDPPRIENVPPSFWDEVGKEAARVLAPFLEKIYLEQATKLIADQPIGVDYAIANEQAIAWAQGYTFDLVRGINETSRTALQRAVSAYFDRGQTIGELEDAIAGIFGPVRAEMISVTEISRAAAEGETAIAEELARQGIMMDAFWLTNRDEKVCPICRPLDGRQADGYTETRRPFWIHPDSGIQYTIPAHIRCRCSERWQLPKVSRG